VLKSHQNIFCQILIDTIYSLWSPIHVTVHKFPSFIVRWAIGSWLHDGWPNFYIPKKKCQEDYGECKTRRQRDPADESPADSKHVHRWTNQHSVNSSIESCRMIDAHISNVSSIDYLILPSLYNLILGCSRIHCEGILNTLRCDWMPAGTQLFLQ
jgi:hypothetical protein